MSRNVRVTILVLALVLLTLWAIILPPLVNANRVRGRLAASLSSALGRPVKLENVTLRLLPRPGFAFEDLEVGEDPAFGSEPAMRAASVIVAVRVAPLLRGRIEVATISLDQASLNVARNLEGRWNFESILERSAELPAKLPTAPRRTSAGQRFPYLEVTNGRVNFKRGAEKLPVSFTDAEFALWLNTPTEWRLRFRAQPVRTDLDAAYTGEFRVEGSVVRAAGKPLSELRIVLSGTWRSVPLGQLTRMLRGHDGGWRGESSVEFTLRGTADDAAATARARIDGLRRDEFVPASPLLLDAACNAQLSLLRKVADKIACALPAGAGSIQLAAEDLSFPRSDKLYLAIDLRQLPAEWALDSLRLVRQGIAPDLAAQGVINGSFKFAKAGGAPSLLTGAAQWTRGSLTAASLPAPITIPAVRLAAREEAKPSGASRARRTPRARARLLQQKTDLSAAALHLEPMEISLGGADPLAISGSMGSRSYAVTLAGGVNLANAMPLLRALGLARWQMLRAVHGEAEAALTAQDTWMHFGAQTADVRGAIRLRNVTAETAWLPGPIGLARADVTLAPDTIAWNNMQWSWAGAKFEGSADKAKACAGDGECPWQISAHAPLLNLQQLQNLFLPSGEARFIDLFRANAPGGWPRFQINLAADSVIAGPFTVADANIALLASGPSVQITNCSGSLLGGPLDCSATISLDRGVTDVTLGLTRVSLANAGALFHEKWGKGTLEASINLELRSGSGVSGDYTAMVRNAALAGASANSLLGRIDSWHMVGAIAKDHITLDHSLLSSGESEVPVTGAIGFDRRLDLTMTLPGGHARHITGTIQQIAR